MKTWNQTIRAKNDALEKSFFWILMQKIQRKNSQLMDKKVIIVPVCKNTLHESDESMHAARYIFMCLA